MGKLETPTHSILDSSPTDYTILACPTYEQPRTGDFIPKQVRSWLGRNGHYVIGVIGTGNLNFGHTYCQAAHDIADCLGVPVLWRCELRGTSADVEAIDSGIANNWGTLVQMRLPQPQSF